VNVFSHLLCRTVINGILKGFPWASLPELQAKVSFQDLQFQPSLAVNETLPSLVLLPLCGCYTDAAGPDIRYPSQGTDNPPLHLHLAKDLTRPWMERWVLLGMEAEDGCK
jgi:hypothetical protein